MEFVSLYVVISCELNKMDVFLVFLSTYHIPDILFLEHQYVVPLIGVFVLPGYFDDEVSEDPALGVGLRKSHHDPESSHIEHFLLSELVEPSEVLPRLFRPDLANLPFLPVVRVVLRSPCKTPPRIWNEMVISPLTRLEGSKIISAHSAGLTVRIHIAAPWLVPVTWGCVRGSRLIMPLPIHQSI